MAKQDKKGIMECWNDGIMGNAGTADLFYWIFDSNIMVGRKLPEVSS